MDAITLLRNDHKTIEQLFKRFEKAGQKAERLKKQLVREMVEELSVHAVIEEQVFYPAVRNELPDANEDVLESLEEHHVVKWICSELYDMEPSDERFDAKVAVLTENVRLHVEFEQSVLFAEVREALPRRRLNELGDLLAQAKKAAPRRPHPRTPDTPPANLVTGIAAAAVDRVREAVSR